MTWKLRLNSRADRAREKHRAARLHRTAVAADGAASDPQEALVRAAEAGQFEALVARAQSAEPIVMVTPEQREAERRAAGTWPEDKPRPPPDAAPPAESAPPVPEPGMPTEPTPGMKWAEEHMTRRPRGRRDYREPVPYGRCLTEYDVLTGEIIGDGYIHYDEEDDEG